jgi:hypothetical protein
VGFCHQSCSSSRSPLKDFIVDRGVMRTFSGRVPSCKCEAAELPTLHLILTATSFLRLEVEMIGQAHKMGLLTTPYAFDEEQAKAMAEAGADIGEGRLPSISTPVALFLYQLLPICRGFTH